MSGSTGEPSAERAERADVSVLLGLAGVLRRTGVLAATVSFSNGDQIETDAGVVAEILEVGEYTRPAEYVGEPEGH